jgi:hypothetical protein
MVEEKHSLRGVDVRAGVLRLGRRKRPINIPITIYADFNLFVGVFFMREDNSRIMPARPDEPELPKQIHKWPDGFPESSALRLDYFRCF